MGLVDGKVAIVTGAGHGVGRGEALALAKEGAKVVVNDLGGSVGGEGADKRPAEEVAEVIRNNGGEAVANYDDVADWNGAKNLIQQAVDSFGKLDILVNNAGILRDGMLFKMTEADFDAVIRVHLKGTFATTHHAANSRNSAPTDFWLASDLALHVTGQVFRAVGSTIARCEPWTLQEELQNPNGEEQWDPIHIGPIVNSYVFHSRNPGLQMGAMRKSTR